MNCKLTSFKMIIIWSVALLNALSGSQVRKTSSSYVYEIYDGKRWIVKNTNLVLYIIAQCSDSGNLLYIGC